MPVYSFWTGWITQYKPTKENGTITNIQGIANTPRINEESNDFHVCGLSPAVSLRR